ncbi:MAG: energy-coupling factor transporter transmembrane protein EcfT [Acidobacteria bacterium]|nr:energy-coupling factor transporter transmembrane protein EcfT [Acidobacteriota bacterium]
MSRPRLRWDEVLLRVLPGDSALRRMWAGTKLIGLAVATIGWLLLPGWGAAVTALALVVAALVAAHVPLSVLPRPRWWLVGIVLLGAVTAAVGGQLAAFVQAFAITFGVVALGAIVAWTTPLAEVADALLVLGAPLRRWGWPVGEWAAACALGVRSLPMLLDEWRVLVAVHRLRSAVARRVGVLDRGRAALALPLRALVMTLRRAREVGVAVAARGGPPDPGRKPVRLHGADLAALTAIIVSIALAWLVPA